MFEIDSCLRDIASAIDAGANVLELEVNEDSAPLRAAWSSLSAALGRARSAVSDLRDVRAAAVTGAPATPTRSPIDDGI
jgi:hypothetical protein